MPFKPAACSLPMTRITLMIILAAFAGAGACGQNHDGPGRDGAVVAPSADAGAPPPSCGAGGAGTGSCGSAGESCCATILVPGGQYSRSYEVGDAGASGFADPASVSSFRLDKYEVTVGRFRAFVAAVVAGWTPPVGAGKHSHLNGGQGLVNVADAGGYEPGWRTTSGIANTTAAWNANLSGCNYSTWTPSAGANENYPINCVNWDEAFAFCIWDEGFLPSEAEWEYAAAGGGEQRMYPWGSTDPGVTTAYAIHSCDVQLDGGECAAAPVGTATLGAGKWGQLDMAGNVSEWTADSYATYVDPCVDCTNATAFADRVMRGGDFFSPTAQLDIVSPARFSTRETDRVYGNGVRCARAP